MKKFFIITSLILLVSTTYISAQWCPPGATWHYGYDVFSDAGYYKVQYVGDTILNNVVCKKLTTTEYHYDYVHELSNVIFRPTRYTYSDDDKVYIYAHNQFYVLYDFSASIGSSWVIPELKRFNSGCDTVGIIKVDSIGTTVIDNLTLRYICVSRLDNNQKWGWSAKIVERIGPVRSFVSYHYDYLFPQKFDYCGMVADQRIEGGSFRCYSDNNFSFHAPNAPACDFVTDRHEIKVADGFSIYPSPSSGQVSVDIPGTGRGVLKFYDVSGSLKFEKVLADKHSELNGLPTGFYIVQLVKEDTSYVTRLLIKE